MAEDKNFNLGVSRQGTTRREGPRSPHSSQDRTRVAVLIVTVLVYFQYVRGGGGGGGVGSENAEPRHIKTKSTQAGRDHVRARTVRNL